MVLLLGGRIGIRPRTALGAAPVPSVEVGIHQYLRDGTGLVVKKQQIPRTARLDRADLADIMRPPGLGAVPKAPWRP